MRAVYSGRKLLTQSAYVPYPRVMGALPVDFSKVKQVAFETKQKDIYFRQYLPKFADLMPAFGPELSRFPKNISVQSPLQQIFAIYMHCYDLMLQNLLSVQPACEFLQL
jgi:hypothetical protein